MITPKIIYQDKSLLVLDKPTGWVVNDADTTKNLCTVQGWLKENFQYPIANLQLLRSGIVHRLDKPTSGVLLVAKTEKSFVNLQVQFKDRKVKKTYIALVHGKVDPPAGGEGEIDAPTGRLPWNRRKFGVLPGGREAVTRYKVVAYYMLHDTCYTLLKLYPKTGRTHQIRIHLKHLGHPIVGDKTYAGRKTWRHDNAWCERLFLHAAKISFKHPETGEKVSFESGIPKSLKHVLEKLR
jgi:23S rRNA pseudouridine1911/1915/1917 synthase